MRIRWSKRAVTPPVLIWTRCALMLSDDAYARLCTLARIHGHIKDHTVTARGIASFIQRVFHEGHLTDARPPHIASEDEERKRAGVAGEWHLYDMRRPRITRVTQETLIAASVWAVRLGIATVTPPRLEGAPHFGDSVPCLSALLEAIGTDWIHVELPPAASTQRRRRTRIGNLDPHGGWLRPTATPSGCPQDDQRTS